MIAFQDYLEAKADLDARSRNPQVYSAFLEGLGALAHARILDAGCGTGVMVRRLLEEELPCSLEIVGLDSDAASLRAARERTESPAALFVEGDLLEAALEGPFDAVMAHSFMDIVPLDRTLSVIGGLLADGGLFYATLTYDGRTLLFPPAGDPAFESRLLAVYDKSMDERRVHGAPTGGSRAGARLLAAAEAAGFDTLACGASDWSVCPAGGRYRAAGDAVFLQAILEMMHAEGSRQGLDEGDLDPWLRSRLADLRSRRLGLIVHQVDLLARRGQRPTRRAG